MHLVIEMFIHGVFYLFIVSAATNAGGAQRAMATIFGTASVLLFIVTFLVLIGFLIRQVNTFCRASIAVMGLIKHKTFSAGFVLTKVWDVSSNVTVYTSLQCPATAITCVSCYLFYLKFLLLQISNRICQHLAQTFTVSSICKMGFYIGDHMRAHIHCCLHGVVQLAGLTRLYRYSRIPVGGGVMRMVTYELWSCCFALTTICCFS